MLAIVLLSALAVATAAPPKLSAADDCNPTVCTLPNCRCASTKPPEDVPLEQIPQFVFFTFDDAVQELNYQIYSDIFDNRTNPDGCPVSATFFVSHDYTDYSRVHDLYVKNHEIALHSITHTALTDYWRDISLDNLTHEFGDEKIVITTFANIPDDAIQGMRIPYLQLSGDNTFLVGKDIGLSYDCSWPTQTYRNPGLWPYTLDYRSTQDCLIGPCPTDSIPGMWVVPMIDWTDQQNIVCSMVDACVNIPDNTDDLLAWFIDNFNVQYKGNRAPFGFYVHEAYFNADPVHQEAYERFVDYLQTLNDVYLVTPTTALEWLRNPVPIGSSEWPACRQVVDPGCNKIVCPLKKDDEDRYMTACVACPAVYPWMGNPLGEDQ